MSWAVYRTIETNYYYVLRTGQPQDPVCLGQGDSLREAVCDLQPTPYQSAHFSCVAPTAARFLEAWPDIAKDLDEAEDVLMDVTSELDSDEFPITITIYATPEYDWYYALRIGKPYERPALGQGDTPEGAANHLLEATHLDCADLGCQPPHGDELHRHFPVPLHLICLGTRELVEC